MCIIYLVTMGYDVWSPCQVWALPVSPTSPYAAAEENVSIRNSGSDSLEMIFLVFCAQCPMCTETVRALGDTLMAVLDAMETRNVYVVVCNYKQRTWDGPRGTSLRTPCLKIHTCKCSQFKV